MEFKEEVATAIDDYCKENKITLREFAKRVGYSPQAVKGWAQKKTAVNPFIVSDLEDVLGIEFKHKREFILYKGEEFLSVGMLHEIAAETGVGLGTLRTLATPARQEQFKKRKNKRTSYHIVELEKDD